METLSLDRAVAQRLSTSLDRYEEALRDVLRNPPPAPAQTAADACYAALRLQQRARWPAGSALVDMLGLSAGDLLEAWDGQGPQSTRFIQAKAQHALCVLRLREALGEKA